MFEVIGVVTFVVSIATITIISKRNFLFSVVLPKSLFVFTVVAAFANFVVIVAVIVVFVAVVGALVVPVAVVGIVDNSISYCHFCCSCYSRCFHYFCWWFISVTVVAEIVLIVHALAVVVVLVVSIVIEAVVAIVIVSDLIFQRKLSNLNLSTAEVLFQ